LSQETVRKVSPIFTTIAVLFAAGKPSSSRLSAPQLRLPYDFVVMMRMRIRASISTHTVNGCSRPLALGFETFAASHRALPPTRPA
jgi:hypothetical protein